MHQTRRRAVTGLAAAAAASMVLAACGSDGGGLGEDAAPTDGGDAAAEEPCAALEGETVTFVVPYNPGGGFDTFVRLLEPHLEEQLEGVQVNVENKPGGGGLIGANEVFQSNPDDFTIGLINYPGAVFAEVTAAEGVQFDNSEWTFLARLGAINPIVYTGEDSGYPDFQSMIDAEEPIRFGIGGVGSDAYYATVVMSEVLGFPAEIIAGYPGGGEADAALLVGEVDASVGSADATLSRIGGTGTHINALIGTEPNEDLPDVPLITEFGDAEQQAVLTGLASIYDLERTVVGPPGMDEGTAECLADAIFTAATAGGYEKDMAAAELTASPMERSEVRVRVEQVDASIDELAPFVQSAG
jgi:tripartite-type tricarboxylate transporter receptor subunit TctC